MAAKQAPRAVIPSISKPSLSTVSIRLFRIPSSMMCDMMVGCSRSHTASSVTQQTAVKKSRIYLFKYFL